MKEKNEGTDGRKHGRNNGGKADGRRKEQREIRADIILERLFKQIESKIFSEFHRKQGIELCFRII